jgi:hypothetical protein
MATAAPPRGANPFDDSGVRADTGGVLKGPLCGADFGAPLFG